MKKIILSKKGVFFLFFAFFLLQIFIAVVTKHTFLGVQDESMLQATLKGGDVCNYMTSYPLAIFVGYLYDHFPSIQWYSIMMISYTILISFILSVYLVSVNIEYRILNLVYKLALFMLSILAISYMLLVVDVTTPTLLLIVLAIPLIRNKQIYFWVLLWIASFLREQIIVSILPLIFLAYAMNFDKNYFNKKKKILISLIFILGFLFNHFSYKLDKTYDTWMGFTESRAYYTDFGGLINKNNLLTSDEYHLSKTWWILDLDLYPFEKIEKSAGTTFDIVKERLLYEYFQKQVRSIFKRHPILYMLILFSILSIFLNRSWIKMGGYLFFFIGFLVLLLVKDVERVTLPILLMWWVLILIDFWYEKEKRQKQFISTIIIFGMLGMVYLVMEVIPLDRIIEYDKKETLFKEFKNIIDKNHMELEITSGYPASWERLIEAIMENHLFDEPNWVGYDKKLLLSGWLTTAPLPYAQHHISYQGVKRKYEHYHDWLIAKNTGIIGSKGESKHIRPFLKNRLMKLYDAKFPKLGCKHIPIVVDESKHFIIHQIIEKCSPIYLIQNISVAHMEKQWDIFHSKYRASASLKLDGKILKISNNDPWILIESSQPNNNGNVILDIRFKSSGDIVFQVFYKEKKKSPYREENSYSFSLKKGSNHVQLKIPAKYMNNILRIDPVNRKGNYEIESFAIYKGKL